MPVPGGGNDDGTVFAVRTQLFQAGQRFALHGVGFDLLAFALFEDCGTRWCLMTQLLFVALEILFVLGNPRLGERFGIGKLGFHLRLDLVDEFAAFQGRDFEDSTRAECSGPSGSSWNCRHTDCSRAAIPPDGGRTHTPWDGTAGLARPNAPIGPFRRSRCARRRR